MADFRNTLYSIDEGGGGAISWPPLLEISRTVSNLACLPGDLLAALCDRLKSEATHVVLNTLTALHTLCLNSSQPVRDQLVGSKVLRALERLLNKPPFPGVEVAAAQLLMDWTFLYGQEELGHRAFAALTSTSRHRAMLQAMAASDVAVLLKEDAALGLPRYCPLTKGMDFQRHFAAAQLGSPVAGAPAPSVASQLAKAAVATSYSDDAAAAAAAAASRNTFAAWAERVAQDPPAAAQRVLNSQANIQSDLDALEAAQEACVAAARDCAKQQQPSAHHTSSSSRPQQAGAAGAAARTASGPGMLALRHQLDKAYLAACKANEWREMTEVLVQQQLPDTQLSSLLSLADKINSVLDSWQQAATTEVFWLLGVDTAGLADGSLLPGVVAAATAAAGSGATAAAAAAAAAAGSPAPAKAAAAAAGPAAAAAAGAGSSSKQQPSGGPASLTRGNSSYLDLLTGDTPAALSTSNPFLTSNTGAGATSAAAAAAKGAAAAAAPAATDELQRYLQELGMGRGSVGTAASSSQDSGSCYEIIQPQVQQPKNAPGQFPGSSVLQQQQHQQQQQQQRQQSYPSIQHIKDSGSADFGPQVQQQQQTVGWMGIQPPLQHYPQIPPVSQPPLQQQQQQQQQRQRHAGHGMDRAGSSSSIATAGSNITLAPHQGLTPAAAASGASSGPHSTGSAAAAAGAPAAAAAGDSGSSSDGASPVPMSYTNPFAALDTNAIMRGLKVAGAGAGHASAAAAAGRGGGGGGVAGRPRSSMDGSSSSHANDAHHTQQPKRAAPPPPQQQQQPVQSQAHHQPPLQQQQQQQQQGQWDHLRAKVQQLFQGASGGGQGAAAHQAASCTSCGLPSRPALEPAVLQLLVEQQLQHELVVQQLQAQHQQQVAEIKAMAVQRFKELQQQLTTQQHPHQHQQ